MLITEYSLKWEADESKGQPGLIRENHYRPLFAPDQVDKSFRPEDRWHDIGANIGAFALRASQRCSVVAVEPEPLNLDCLTANMRLNGLTDKIELVRAAVVGQSLTGTVDLAISNSFSSTHRVGTIRGRQSIQVRAYPINDILAAYRINKVKIDAEGSEAEILEAMSFAGIDELVFEYHFAFLKDNDWTRFGSIIQLIRDNGFLIKKAPLHRSKTWHTIVWAVRPGD